MSGRGLGHCGHSAAQDELSPSISKTSTLVGLDAHKDTIVVGHAIAGVGAARDARRTRLLT